MNLYFRLFAVLLREMFQQQLPSFFESVRIPFRVWPTDLDALLHMNNGRYLTIMDLGRIAHVSRSGLLRLAKERAWYPVLGSAVIRYRRPLKPFQRFVLETKLLGWDEKWFFIEQSFFVKDELAAKAYVKGIIRCQKKSVPTAEVLQAADIEDSSPEIPSGVLTALSLEQRR